MGAGRAARRRTSPSTWCGPKASTPRLAARSGDLVLLYHLLWELTHVVFEHPGLLAPRLLLTPTPASSSRSRRPSGRAATNLAAPNRRPLAVCITCSDHGEVAEVRPSGDGRAEVLVGGRSQMVDVSLVDPVGARTTWSWSTPGWPSPR